MYGWLHREGDSVVLMLHIQPGAKKTEVVGLHGDALKIRLAAPPVDGKANAALVAFVAAKVSIGKTAVEVISGLGGRAKRVRIRCDLGENEIAQCLLSKQQ